MAAPKMSYCRTLGPPKSPGAARGQNCNPCEEVTQGDVNAANGLDFPEIPSPEAPAAKNAHLPYRFPICTNFERPSHRKRAKGAKGKRVSLARHLAGGVGHVKIAPLPHRIAMTKISGRRSHGLRGHELTPKTGQSKTVRVLHFWTSEIPRGSPRPKW